MSVKIERILPKNGDVFTCISGAASVFVASRNLTLVISASPVAGEVREIRNDPHSLAILSLRHGPETLAAQNGGDWKFPRTMGRRQFEGSNRPFTVVQKIGVSPILARSGGNHPL